MEQNDCNIESYKEFSEKYTDNNTASNSVHASFEGAKRIEVSVEIFNEVLKGKP